MIDAGSDDDVHILICRLSSFGSLPFVRTIPVTVGRARCTIDGGRKPGAYTENNLPTKLTKTQLREFGALFGAAPVLSYESEQHYNEMWENLIECFLPNDFMELLFDPPGAE